jgi:hypothetical protein
MTDYFSLCICPPPAHPRLTGMVRIDTASKPADVARQLRSLPPGRRAVCFSDRTLFWGQKEDLCADGTQGPNLQAGMRLQGDWCRSFFGEIRAARATVDFFITDLEVGLSNWTIQQAGMDAIKSDPRFAAFIAQTGITDFAGAAMDPARLLAWDAVAAGWVARAMNIGFAMPISSIFPDVVFSEFCGMRLSAEQAQYAPDPNGWKQPVPGPWYDSRITTAYYGCTCPSQACDWTDPLNTIAYQLNVARAMRRTDPDTPHLSWFPYPSYAGDGTLAPNPRYPLASSTSSPQAGSTSSPQANSPYAAEFFFHHALSTGSTASLYFNNNAPGCSTPQQDKSFGDAVEALAAAACGQRLDPIFADPLAYDSKMILSGAMAGGRPLYRISFSPSLGRGPGAWLR